MSQRETRRLDEALRSIEHSLQISEGAAAKNPDFLAHRFNYAGTIRQLGLIHRDRGATDEAIRAFRRSIEVYASLAADQRDPKQSLAATADLGLALADQAPRTGTRHGARGACGAAAGARGLAGVSEGRGLERGPPQGDRRRRRCAGEARI